MKKIKVMIDNNILDELIKLNNMELENIIEYSEIWIPIIQWNEFKKYKESKNFNIGKFNKIKDVIKVCNIEKHFSGYFGFAPDCVGFGQGCFISDASIEYGKRIEEYMNEYSKKKPNENTPFPNRADSWLALLAKDYGCVVVTQDGTGKNKGLYQAIKNQNDPVWSFDEFFEQIGLKMKEINRGKIGS